MNNFRRAGIDVRQKTVSPTRNGLDEPGTGCIVIQNGPDLCDGDI